MIPFRLNKALHDVLIEAYAPCGNFGVCREAKWSPGAGHMPRGFLGGAGSAEDVEVVLVFAEPGHPHHDEHYDATLPPAELMRSGLRHVYSSFANGTDLFHRNVRWFLSELYPSMSFDEQLKHVWLTEGRLCSIDDEIGNVRDGVCASHFLRAQLTALPNATVVACGGKAKSYLRRLRVDHLEVYAFAPPGANYKRARPSWHAAIVEIKGRRMKNL